MKPVPKMSSGASAPSVYADASDQKVEPKRRGRPPGPGRKSTEYERARIREVEGHAELFELRVAKMRGELLDRSIIAREMDLIFGTIKELILGLPISDSHKADVLRNLSRIPLILDNVAEKQNKTYEEAPSGNGHSDE